MEALTEQGDGIYDCFHQCSLEFYYTTELYSLLIIEKKIHSKHLYLGLITN